MAKGKVTKKAHEEETVEVQTKADIAAIAAPMRDQLVKAIKAEVEKRLQAAFKSKEAIEELLVINTAKSQGLLAGQAGKGSFSGVIPTEQGAKLVGMTENYTQWEDLKAAHKEAPAAPPKAEDKLQRMLDRAKKFAQENGLSFPR